MRSRIAHSIFIILFCCPVFLLAQNPGNIIKGLGNRIPGMAGGGGGGGGSNDSLHIRSKFEDSITVSIYYLDSTGTYKLDSSISDFTRRFPIPATDVYLGNTGAATRSILFTPSLQPGFDPGFHALDNYTWKLEQVPFFNTTRPYTELDYLIGGQAEQIIEILHTQNIKPNWNFSLDYRLISAPGFFRNQTSNHNNYRLASWYQSRNKRYNNYLVFLGNRLQVGENGGIKSESDLDNIQYAKDRRLIPTWIGGDPTYITNFFSTALNTGDRYRIFNILLRQQYDLGRKDSLITDSTVVKLFYPRLRFEHNFRYGKYSYSFFDIAATGQLSNIPDSAYYHDNYSISLPKSDSLTFRDRWNEVSNDFSIYQFPDERNLRQYIKLGAELQLLQAHSFHDSVGLPVTSLYNFMAHGEYRNRTKNQRWDMLAYGQLYLNGYNMGDYHAYVNLQRRLGARAGSLSIGFENANKKAPFIYDQRSGFYLDVPATFNKENITHAFASLFVQKLKLQLGGDYYLMGNYLYLSNFYKLQQESTLFTVLRLSGSKVFRISRHWNWYADLWFQQKTGGAQLHLPAIYTRNRLMYEGTFGFRNLNIAFGAEVRYHTPYMADNYSPVLQQFFYQDSVTISNLPDIAGFLHFRIRSFKAFIRAENLNTLRGFGGGLQFNNNNLAAPGYPTPGIILRFGVYWSFVN
ncbi:MAG: putative porin [Flavisolibacter sp.]